MALAGLLEKRRTDFIGHDGSGQRRISQCHGAAWRNLRVAEELLAIALDLALLIEALHQHAEGAVGVLPCQHRIGLRLDLAGQITVFTTNEGRGRERVLQIEGMDGLDIDAARDAAFGHVGTLGLVHHDGADHFGGEQ